MAITLNNPSGIIIKKFFLNFLPLFFILAIPLSGLTQNEPSPLPDPKSREKIEAARIAMISNKLELTPEQAEKFWPVYREFTSQRAELRKQFFEAKKQINPDKPDPEQQQKLVELGLTIRQKELDLEKDYSVRLLRIISAQQMLKLHSAEKDFQQMVLQQIQQRRNIQQRKEFFRDKNQQLRQRRN